MGSIALRRAVLFALAALAPLAPGSLALAKDDDLEVTVERLDGAKRTPAAGVVVTASAADAKEHWHTYFEGRTGADGGLRVPSKAGPFEVTATEHGYLGSRARLGALSPRMPLTLALLPFATLVVHARDSKGTPRPGVDIALAYESTVIPTDAPL